MARSKSLLPNLVVDEAKKAHDCQHNRAHRLQQGDKRLRVRVQRTYEHFCTPSSSRATLPSSRPLPVSYAACDPWPRDKDIETGAVEHINALAKSTAPGHALASDA